MRQEYQKDWKTSTERGFARIQWLVDYLSWFEKSWCGTFNATKHGIGVEICSKNSLQILLDPGLIGARQRMIQATWSVCSTWPPAGRDDCVSDCKQREGRQQDVHRWQQGSTCWMTSSRDFDRPDLLTTTRDLCIGWPWCEHQSIVWLWQMKTELCFSLCQFILAIWCTFTTGIIFLYRFSAV